MSRLVFGDAIDYSKVRIHNREYLWFGLQPDDTAMAPNGHIYFNPKYFKEDFSSSPLSDQMWLIHEMTHVWQHQLGYPVKWRGALRMGLSYKYKLEPGRTLGDFNMEAQGNILADYYVLKFKGLPGMLAEANHRNDPQALALFEQVLAEFLQRPSDKRNLP